MCMTIVSSMIFPSSLSMVVYFVRPTGVLVMAPTKRRSRNFSADGMKRFAVSENKAGDIPVHIHHSGFTGELGYEVYCRIEDTQAVEDDVFVGFRQIFQAHQLILGAFLFGFDQGLLADKIFVQADERVTVGSNDSPAVITEKCWL